MTIKQIKSLTFPCTGIIHNFASLPEEVIIIGREDETSSGLLVKFSDGNIRSIICLQVETMGTAIINKARAQDSRRRAYLNAKAKHEALTSLGLVRVRGALGGIYYE